MIKNNLMFPKEFIFGVADADLQVVGEDYTRVDEGSQETMWNRFALKSGQCYKNTPPGKGIDRYHHWKDDVEIIKKLGVSHYRTSISMARIFREDGDINSKAINWYRNYFKELQKKDIRIHATLYHWELPQSIQEEGGWLNRKTVELLPKHAETVVQQLGEYIDEYYVLNEPWASSFVGYYYGVHAPGEKNLNHALIAAHNLLLSQGLTMRRMKEIDTSLKVSTVLNLSSCYAATLTSADMKAKENCDGFINKWFLDPIYKGHYPEDMMELWEKFLPKFPQEDLQIIRIGDLLNNLGINYYHGHIVTRDSSNPLGFKDIPNIPKAPATGLNWPIFMPPYYPEGLYDLLRETYFSYHPYGLRKILITENGMAEKARVNDKQRTFFLQEHLRQVYKAISSGIPIGGYFPWTLMDNFEWAEGYRPESAFGLIYVDRKTMKRVWKESAYWYQNLIKSRLLKI